MARKRSYEVVSAEDMIRRISSWIVDIILVVILAFFLTWAFGTRVTMEGNSMMPLMDSGDKMLINRTKGSLVPLKRFDLAAYTQEGEDSVYLKLILGLPGETVQIRDGKVLINDQPLADERISFSIPNAGIAEDPVILGEDEYFVLGDNRELFRSKRMYSTEKQRISVNVRGVRVLELRLDEGDKHDKDYDHGDWANAWLEAR